MCGSYFLFYISLPERETLRGGTLGMVSLQWLECIPTDCFESLRGNLYNKLLYHQPPEVATRWISETACYTSVMKWAFLGRVFLQNEFLKPPLSPPISSPNHQIKKFNSKSITLSKRILDLTREWQIQVNRLQISQEKSSHQSHWRTASTILPTILLVFAHHVNWNDPIDSETTSLKG